MQRPRDVEDGAVATEYVFLLLLIALAVVIAVAAYGGTLSEAWTDGSSAVESAVG